MTDIDALAHFDPNTGSPIFDNRTAAIRWLDALDNSPVSTPSPAALPYNNFGQVGAGETTNETAAPTAAKKGKYNMYYVNNSDNDPIPSNLEEADCAETFGSVFQHLWSEGGEVQAQVGSISMTLALEHNDTTVSICCGTEVIQPVALQIRSSIALESKMPEVVLLRLLSELNRCSAGARFYLHPRQGADSFITAAWTVPVKSGMHPAAFAEAVSLFAVSVCIAQEQIGPVDVPNDTEYTGEDRE